MLPLVRPRTREAARDLAWCRAPRGARNSKPEHTMAVEHQLKGKRIAVLAADGFEKVELTVPVAALRAAGAHAEIVSLRPGRIRGVNLHEPASRVSVDHTISEVSVGD